MAEIGHWGRKHREHLKRHRPKMYARLRNSGKLNAYLAEVDKAAEERMERFVQQYLEKNPPPENATEHEKAAHRGTAEMIAEELIGNDLIYPISEENEAEIGPNGGYTV